MIWLALACTPDPTTGVPTTGDTGTTTTPLPGATDPLAGLPIGAEQWALLCARGHTDSVSEAFCEGDAPPTIGSFAALRTLLGLGGDSVGGDSSLRVTAAFHSSALGARFVTPLNPRAFLFTKPRGVLNPGEPQPDERYTVLAFARGETFVELASKDPATLEPRFFLLRFDLPCADAGCTAADLLTSATESGWTGWTLYDDGDVANTTLDCLRCHQPEGPGTDRILLMQELRNPWNHWFYEEQPKNVGSIRAFEDAHGETRYADFPVETYTHTRPNNLQILVQNNSPGDQPNEYDSAQINEELEQTGTSPTWDALFARSLTAEAKPVPYVDNPQVDGTWDYTLPYQPVLDPTSPLGVAVDAFRGVVDGDLPGDQLPDLAALWLPEALDAIGYRAQAGLDDEGLLRQVCGQCHNERLDPTLSRAKFSVDAVMPRAEMDEAIHRLQLPVEDARHMPPARFHVLTDAERDRLVAYLGE